MFYLDYDKAALSNFIKNSFSFCEANVKYLLLQTKPKQILDFRKILYCVLVEDVFYSRLDFRIGTNDDMTMISIT